MTISRFNSKNVDSILDACKEALEIVAEEHGLVLQRKRCTYHNDKLPVAFELIAPERSEDGEAIDPKETEFRRNARMFGLEPDDFGKLFKTSSGAYRVCGIKPKGRKYTVLGESIHNGKTYKFRDIDVVRGLKRSEDVYGDSFSFPNSEVV